MALWINPAPPETEAGQKGFFNLEWDAEPIKDEDIADELDDSQLGHLYLWNKSIWVRGCDEGILSMLDADESHPLFVYRGLTANEIRKRYKERTQPST
jgi:hypothetical protein